MRRVILLLAVAFNFISAICGQPAFHCPVTGLDKNGNVPSARISALNELKNRIDTPVSINLSISLDSILAPGNDKDRFTNQDAASITGYVTNVKSGGLETCNCYYAKDPFVDTHIEIALDRNETNAQNIMIVEVTPRFKALHSDWRTKELKNLMGKKVTITGWMLYDAEHWQNSRNTNPGGTVLWRATAWEIHPITSIKAD